MPTIPRSQDVIAEWAAMPGTVAIRIMMTPEISTDAADPGINRILAAAAKHDLPVNMLARDRLEQLGELAKRNPNTQIVIDHLGLEQPFVPPAPTGAVEGAAARAQGRREQERRDQDQRRLHAQPREVPVQGHLGSARPASSTPTASTAACGAPTGRAR